MRKFCGGLLICFVISSSLFANDNKDVWRGDEYAKNSESQKSSAENFISSLNLQEVSSILDVGCGDGKITAAIASAIPNGRVIGIDSSPSMIAFAKERFSNFSNLNFDIQDAAHIDFQEKFDLITSFTALQWVLEQEQALKGFEQALSPGGKLCILMPTGLPEAMEQALHEMITAPEWKGYFTHFSPPWKFYQPEEYKDLVATTDLTLTRLDTTTKHEKFPSRDAFQGFLRQWLPYLRPLPKELRELFLAELVETYLQILPLDSQGRVTFIVTRFQMEAVRL